MNASTQDIDLESARGVSLTPRGSLYERGGLKTGEGGGGVLGEVPARGWSSVIWGAPPTARITNAARDRAVTSRQIRFGVMNPSGGGALCNAEGRV